nr:hypothetical protein [Psychrobacter sp. PraFG1]UNK04571.1 hypothetical protein MN210_09855 [Psychrobacter sp. PraFG1]
MQTTKEERIMINPSLQWQPNDKVSVIANMFYQDDPTCYLQRRCTQ